MSIFLHKNENNEPKCKQTEWQITNYVCKFWEYKEWRCKCISYPFIQERQCVDKSIPQKDTQATEL